MSRKCSPAWWTRPRRYEFRRAPPISAQSAARALADEPLQRELARFSRGFQVRRVEAASRLPEFEALRDRARDIKNHCLAHLDFYLERFEENCRAAGGEVHWCATAEDARQAILAICHRLGAKTMAKGKSMVSEEIGLNEFLADRGRARSRDRSRRIHPPASRRIAEPYRGARDPCRDRAVDRGLPRRPHRPAGGPLAHRRQRDHGGGPRRAARAVPRRRYRPDGRQFPDRRDRLLGHLHQ